MIIWNHQKSQDPPLAEWELPKQKVGYYWLEPQEHHTQFYNYVANIILISSVQVLSPKTAPLIENICSYSIPVKLTILLKMRFSILLSILLMNNISREKSDWNHPSSYYSTCTQYWVWLGSTPTPPFTPRDAASSPPGYTIYTCLAGWCPQPPGWCPQPPGWCPQPPPKHSSFAHH